MLNGHGDLQIECGPADERGRRVVVATRGAKSHPDRLDVASAFQRQKWAEQVAKKLEIEPAWTAHGGSDYGNLYSDLEQRLMAAAAAEQAENPFLDTVETFTFAQLAELHPQLNPPVVEGLFREGETVNLISNPKVGKSWMAYGLALSIVAGRRWLNQFDVAPGRVLLVDNELHGGTLAHRIPRVAEAMGLGWDDYAERLDVIPLRGNLRCITEMRTIFEAVEPGTHQAIFIDAKYRTLPAGTSENDNAAEAAFYNLVDQYAAMTQSAFVLIHHATKGSQTDKRVTDVGAGAGAQSRAADCHIALREHEEEGVFVLDAAVRSFAPVKPVALRWEYPLWVPELSVDPSKLKGRLTHTEQRQGDRDKEGVDRIVKALMGGPLGMNDLCRKATMGKERANRLIGRLEEENQVTQDTAVIHHNQARVYRLVDHDEEGGL